MKNRTEFLRLIKSNINDYGYHITIVNSITQPRYAYTIGLHDKWGFELIFAGGIYFQKNELAIIFDSIIKQIEYEKNIQETKIIIESLGIFTLSEVDISWGKLLMLGVFDFYKIDSINAFQIKPENRRFTLDIPDMFQKYDNFSNPVWQYLTSEWNYSIPLNSNVVTNLDALQGQTITEVMRWEDNEWEIFAGSGVDIAEENIRIVPLGVIIGIDKTLETLLNLEIGKGAWRESIESGWQDWGSTS